MSSLIKSHDKTISSLPDGNRLIGWASLALGAVSGLILGLWSFDGPVSIPLWIGDYGDTSRRLLRLGHIAFFGLGILNILFAQEASRFKIYNRILRAASLCFNFGNAFLPPALIAAAIYQPLKYLMPFPAISILIALVLTVYLLWKTQEGENHESL